MSRILAAISLFTVAVIGARVAEAQTLPSKKEAAALFQKAAEATILNAPDRPPFHLVGNIHYEIGGKAADGVYELLWSSQDKYRESLRFADAQEIDVALGNKLYVARNKLTIALPLWFVRTTLRSLRHYFPGTRYKISKTFASAAAGEKLTCVNFGYEHSEGQACLNSSTNQMFSLSLVMSSLATKAPTSLGSWSLNDFAAIGRSYYAKRIHHQELDEKIDIEVQDLALTSMTDEMFEPPPGAEAQDWCAHPTVNGHGNTAFEPVGLMDPPGAKFAYYVFVGPDGRAKRWVTVRSGGSRIDGEMGKRFQNERFPIQSCGEKTITYELLVPAQIAVRLSP